MNAYIYDDKQTAEKVARTFDKFGLECSVVGSAVIAHPGEYELFREQAMAPDVTVVAKVREVN